MEDQTQGQPAPSTVETRIEALASTLTKSTTQIKKARSTEIAEMIETEMRRKVEDAERKVKQIRRRRASAMDLSPDNTYSLIRVADFDAEEFVKKYNEAGLDLRKAIIEANNAKVGYNEVMGHTFELEKLD